MLNKIAAGAGVAALAVAMAASPASAAPKNDARPVNDGAYCVQQGLGTLKSLGLLQAAAQRQIDYSTLADPVTGPIFADLPEGSNYSLGYVVKLHTTNPGLFAWCAR